jgi:hypothetical protein
MKNTRLVERKEWHFGCNSCAERQGGSCAALVALPRHELAMIIRLFSIVDGYNPLVILFVCLFQAVVGMLNRCSSILLTMSLSQALLRSAS